MGPMIQVGDESFVIETPSDLRKREKARNLSNEDPGRPGTEAGQLRCLMTASDRAAIVPVPPPGTCLLVVEDGDRVRYVLVDVASLCRSPDHAWRALRLAWARLAAERREENGAPAERLNPAGDQSP